jgi:hypothetical protein
MPCVITPQDTAFLGQLFQAVSSDLSMVLDTEVKLEGVSSERLAERAAGKEKVHISFRFLIHSEGTDHHGCFLVPLPDAIGLAAALMMREPQESEAERKRTELDRPTKEALIEVGNFVAGAVDAVIRTWYSPEATCRSAGCQGVRADVRPAFPYREGDELLVGRAKGRVGPYPEFEALVLIPVPPEPA